MKKSNRWIALFTILAMSALLMSSCAGGLTYEDVAGNSSAVDVPARDQLVNVPYTGDPIVEIIEIEGDVIEVTKEDENQGGGESQGGGTEGSGDDAQGGGDNQGDSDNAQGGDDTDDEDFEFDEGEFSWIPSFSSDDVIKVLDQNVRCVSDADKYPGTTREERHLRLAEQVEKYDPDVMGFQEVVPKWLEFLKADYSAEYDYYSWFREGNSATGSSAGDECSPVFWKKDKFDKVDAGHFWLGDNPSAPSKYAGQTDQHRICNWVKLKNKETGKQFIFGSVHYSLDTDARIKSAQTMTSQLKKAAGSVPVICVGDYNMSRNSQEYNALVQAGFLGDLNDDLSYHNPDRDYDSHNTGGGYTTPATAFNENGEAVGGSVIDFVMISSTDTNIYPMSYKVIQEKFGSKHNLQDQFVSDHFGIFAEVVIPSKR